MSADIPVQEAATKFYHRKFHGLDIEIPIKYAALAEAVLNVKTDTAEMKVPPAVAAMIAAESAALQQINKTAKQLSNSAIYLILKILLQHKGFEIQKIPNLIKEQGLVFKGAAVFPGYENDMKEQEKVVEKEEEEEEEEKTDALGEAGTVHEARTEARAEQAGRVESRVGSVSSTGRGPALGAANDPATARAVKPAVGDILKRTLYNATAHIPPNLREPRTSSHAFDRLTAHFEGAPKAASSAPASPRGVSVASSPQASANSPAPTSPRGVSPTNLKTEGGSRSRTRRALLHSIRATLKKNYIK